MYYIISTIILALVIVLLIIFYNDDNIKEYFSRTKKTVDTLLTDIKTKNEKLCTITQLTYKDSLNILQFLKMKYNYDSILIPKTLSYKKEEENGHVVFVFKNIKILGITNNNGITNETQHIITLKFIPMKNDTFISEYNLFGINGNFILEQTNEENIQNNDNVNIGEESVLDLIPDIVKLSESGIEPDSIINTTESIINNINLSKLS